MILKKIFRQKNRKFSAKTFAENSKVFKPKFSKTSMENDVEPPGDKKNDKRINLFGIRNIERCIDNSLLYLRWKAFGNPCFISDDFSNYVGVLCYR